MSTSRWSYRSCISVATLRTCSVDERSPTTTSTEPAPTASTSRRVFSPLTLSLAPMTMSAPMAASCVAVSLPMPDVAPVTSTRRPVMSVAMKPYLPRDLVKGRRAAVLDLGAGRGDPCTDGVVPAARTARTAEASARAATAQQDVPHLALGDELLELGERRRRVGPVEAADG